MMMTTVMLLFMIMTDNSEMIKFKKPSTFNEFSDWQFGEMNPKVIQKLDTKPYDYPMVIICFKNLVTFHIYLMKISKDSVLLLSSKLPINRSRLAR